MEEEKEYNEFLEKIDNIELVPSDKLKEMDFYELAFYMQTLNAIDSLSSVSLEDEVE